jgi:hypothetical protein
MRRTKTNEVQGRPIVESVQAVEAPLCELAAQCGRGDRPRTRINPLPSAWRAKLATSFHLRDVFPADCARGLAKRRILKKALRIQTEFMQSQLHAFGEQIKSLGEAYTKEAAGGIKMPFKSSLD